MVEERLQDANHPFRGRYDVVMVDEAQDFTPSWMRVVRLLLKPGGFLSLCDDPTQGIFHNYNWKQKGVDVIGRTRILHVPFRSTFEINAAAHALVDADALLSQSDERTVPDFTAYELENGAAPVMLEYANTDVEAQAIHERLEALLSAGVPAEQIAIICNQGWQIREWKPLRKRGVAVASFDTGKGLEFQAVFLPHLHQLFGEEDDPDLIARRRRKMFMAMTRAR